jgi:hypothetical protein
MSFVRFHILEIGTVIRVLAMLELNVVDVTGLGELHGLNKAKTDDPLMAGQTTSHLLMHKITDMQETINRS